MVSEDYLKQKIMESLQKRARGKENAVPRLEILKILQLFDPELSDRTFRKLYQRLPIAACSAGLFIPRNADEAFGFYTYLEKQIGPIHASVRYRTLLAYYPQLVRVREKQQELFPS